MAEVTDLFQQLDDRRKVWYIIFLFPMCFHLGGSILVTNCYVYL